MISILLVGACAIFGLVGWAFRPSWVIYAIVALRLIVPAPAVPSVMSGALGASTSAHPATFIAAGAVVALALDSLLGTQKGTRSNSRIVHFAVALIIFVAGIGLVTTALAAPGVALILFAADFIQPALVGWLVLGALKRGGLSLGRLARYLVLLVFAEAILMLAQLSLGQPLVWENARLVYQTWFVAGSIVSRPYGTLDSPIEAAIIMVVGIALLPFVRSTVLRFAALFVLTAAAVATQSRFPFALLVFVLVYFAFTQSRTIAQFALAAIGVGGVAVAVAVTWGGSLFARFDAGADSSAAGRGAAWQFVLDNWERYSLAGGGFRVGSSTKGVTLATSLENAYVMLAFDIGFLAALLYLLAQLVLAAQGVRSSAAHRHFGVAASAMIAGGFAFSAFTNPSAYATILWVLLGACVWQPRLPDRTIDTRLPVLENEVEVSQRVEAR